MDDLTFEDTILHCLDNPELVREFNRLSGCKIGLDNRPAIIKMVDEATGYDPFEADYKKFIDFVFQTIWLPLAMEGDNG